MLRIYCINATHSQEVNECLCRNDHDWVCALTNIINYGSPLYITTRSKDTYIFRHFVEQTLGEDGFIIPGDYETDAPGLGKVKYSISNEQNDYWKYLEKKRKEADYEQNLHRH